jgi:hypothetical protein
MTFFLPTPTFDSLDLWYLTAAVLVGILIFRETVGYANTIFGRAIGRLAIMGIIPLLLTIAIVIVVRFTELANTTH